MPYAFIQQRENSDDRGVASNAPVGTGAFVTLGSGNLMVAKVYYNTLGGQRGVTLSGAGSPTWVAETVVFDGSANYEHYFYALNTPGGTTAQLQANFTDIGNGDDVFYPAIYAGEWSGFKTSSARLAFAAQYQPAPTTSANAVTSGLLGTLAAQPAGIIGFTGDVTGSATLTPAAGSSFTSRGTGWTYAGTLAPVSRLEDRRVTATTSVAATFTAAQNTGHMTAAWAFEEATGGGDVSITPSTGSMSTSGIAPVLSQNRTLSGLVGALALVGFAPILLSVGVRQPNTAALAIAGAAPVLNQQVTIRPNAGALTLAGVQPIAGSPGFIIASAGTLNLVGLSPDMTLTLPSPPAAVLSLAGAAPTVTRSFQGLPTVGALALTGNAPALTQALVRQPVTGALVTSGNAATVVSQNLIRPNAGTLTLTAAAPSLQGISTITPATGALTFTGIAPNITTFLSPVIRPDTGALAFGGLSPLGVGGGGGSPGTGISRVGITIAGISGAGISGPGIGS